MTPNLILRGEMKIGIDLKPFTTGSRNRGIGLFSKSFLDKFIALMPDAELHYLNMYSGYNHDLPEDDRCILHSYFTGPQIVDVGERQLFRSSETEPILEAEVKHFLKHSGVDIMLFTSPHEYGNLFKAKWFKGVKTVGMLYDLIPLVFPEQCLFDKTYKEDYYNSLEFVKALDVILTISDSAKNDAVKLLGIPAEKICVIYGGVNDNFRKLEKVNSKEIKNKYQIKNPFIMFAGGIDFKKNIELLIKAYSMLKPIYKNKHQLVIVGKAPEDVTNKYLQIARENDCEGRVICTGFIPEEDLIALYNITEMLVFPSLYEGFGLPVMESMACGARVVTSNCSSLKEIAEDYATLVNPKSVKSIARGITYVLEHPIQTLELAEKATPYARSFTWDNVAEKAISAISDLYISERPEAVSDYSFTVTDGLLTDIVKEYTHNGVTMENYIADTISRQFVILEEDLPESCCGDIPRILFDMTVVRTWVKAKYSTGIGRVSVELHRQLRKLSPVILISVEKGKDGAICRRVNENTMELTQDIVIPKQGDIYFMPELQLKGVQVENTHPDTCSLRHKGVKCFAVLYDILPIMMPQYFEEGTSDSFKNYVKDLFGNYDAIICDSKAVCDDVILYYSNASFELEKRVTLGYFHLGNNSLISGNNQLISPDIHNFFSDSDYIFLMVGTIEPRKGHEFVLKAFEEMWKNNVPVSLCIIGHIGWDMDNLVKKLKNHPEQGKGLLFLEAASDSCLQYAYSNASALIQASAGEGFGLPLIEAGQYGLPILCTDIPVFHEVTNGHALFFDRHDTKNLKACINNFIELYEKGNLPDSSKIPMLTWEQSAKNIFDLFNENQEWYAQINTDGSVDYL